MNKTQTMLPFESSAHWEAQHIKICMAIHVPYYKAGLSVLVFEASQHNTESDHLMCSMHLLHAPPPRRPKLDPLPPDSRLT